VIVLLCPGQGAQKVGMGKDLAERFPAARDVFQRIDDTLGAPLSRLMWEGPEEELTLTHNAQPAILAHSAAVWAVVGDRLAPALKAAAGHSLGEYSAYVAAGSLSAENGARLVRRRGELMYQAGTQRPGAMSAVLGLATSEVDAACREASNADAVAVPANLNAPDQTVISGDPIAVEKAGEACKTRGAKRVLPLKVSGAFHSPLMKPAVPGLQQALQQVTVRGAAGSNLRQRYRGSGDDWHRCQTTPRRAADRAGSMGRVHAGRRSSSPGCPLHRNRAGERAVWSAQANRAGCQLNGSGYGG
jgi:(acyl-carrier-protein) S-malonyltransferase